MECKKYNIDDVNRKILSKEPIIHPEKEYLGFQNKWCDEDYAIYKKSCQQFCEAAGRYKQLNKNALFNTKDKLNGSTDDILRYDNKCECKELPRVRRLCVALMNQMSTGCWCGNELYEVYMRQIYIFTTSTEQTSEEMRTCMLEPWFVRYSRLCRFIYAARKIIVKNRLLRNLEILKRLNKETVLVYENGQRKWDNVSYASLFEKFIN